MAAKFRPSWKSPLDDRAVAEVDDADAAIAADLAGQRGASGVRDLGGDRAAAGQDLRGSPGRSGPASGGRRSSGRPPWPAPTERRRAGVIAEGQHGSQAAVVGDHHVARAVEREGAARRPRPRDPDTRCGTPGGPAGSGSTGARRRRAPAAWFRTSRAAALGVRPSRSWKGGVVQARNPPIRARTPSIRIAIGPSGSDCRAGTIATWM